MESSTGMPSGTALKRGETQIGLSIRKEHISENTVILSAIVNGKIVGGARMDFRGCIPSICPLDAAFLADIKVNPHYREMGIGGELLESAKRIAHQYNFRRVMLEVYPAEEGNLRFYQRRGFVEIEGNPLGINNGQLLITRSIEDELRKGSDRFGLSRIQDIDRRIRPLFKTRVEQ
ncbi:MAG: GNAT family N-acetyltransferase [Candidatus Micrarchaeales archaeon]|nr:GNAT family N-acetyltransferase [Candidatus Micrarchaeales archaeon]